MTERITQAHLGFLVGQRNFRALMKMLATMNEVDIADFINNLPEAEAVIIFRLLNKAVAADVFSELDPDSQRQLVEAINDKEIAALFDAIAVDDAVDMLEEMPAVLVKRILRNASADTRKLLNQYLLYPEDSVGSVMTAEFTDLAPDMSAKEAIAHIRKHGQDKETIYNCYVVDSSNMLLGVVTVRALLTTRDNALVKDLMSVNLISVHTTDTSEHASKMLRKYSLISVPVVDDENRLVGIVTIDDAADVLQEETTEDLERMAAMTPSDKPYLKTGVMELAKNRFFWLLILMLSGIVSEMVVGRYELAISAVPLLVAFIPMLSDMGGDAGSQVSTLVIRGMALDEIEGRGRDTLALFGKEVIVSLMVGIPLGVLNFLRVYLVNDQAMVALTISIALVCTIIMANTLGVFFPVLSRRLKIDPALMATPMIATIVDILSMMIYFGLAVLLLRV
jgi:Mg2+ transporter (mgtE)